MKFTKKQIIVLIVVFVCVVSFRLVANTTTFFVNADQQVPEGYLALEDYILLDSKDNPTSSVHALDFDYSDHYSFYDSRKQLHTTKGISNASSWEDLLNAYGDYYAESISASLPYNSDTYDDSTNVYENDMTLNEFNEKYIETGKVSLDTHNINIYYYAYTRLSKIYYTDEEKLDTLYSSNSIFWNFKIHTFQLSISYACKNDDFNETGKGIIDYISSDRWSYD